MKLLADECIDAGLVAALRVAGHDALFVAEAMPGKPDTEVLEQAYREERLLLTEDKDFGELVYRLGLRTRGIILLRIAPDAHATKVKRLLELLIDYEARLAGTFFVVEAERMRYRTIE